MKLRTELTKVDDVGLTFLVGGRPEEVRIEPAPGRMAARGVTLGDASLDEMEALWQEAKRAEKSANGRSVS